MRLTPTAVVTILSNLLALVMIGVAAQGWPAEPILSYNVHKVLHIVGVVIFMGNMIAGPVWLAMAWFAGDAKLMAFAARTLGQADLALTVPGVQLTLWNGIFLASVHGGVMKAPWLREAMILLIGTSIVSTTLVLYCQEKFIHVAQGDDTKQTLKWLLIWSFWGTLVGGPFSLVAWLMVNKQPLGWF